MIDEDIFIDEKIKTGFNLGYRLGQTTAGRNRAAELVKGKENLPMSQAIKAGVDKAVSDYLDEQLNKVNNKQKKP